MYLFLLIIIFLNIIYNLSGIYYILPLLILTFHIIYLTFILLHNPDFDLVKIIRWLCIIIVIYIIIHHINLLFLKILLIIF